MTVNNIVLSGPYNFPLFAAGGGSTPFYPRMTPKQSATIGLSTPPGEKALCSDCLSIDLHKLDAQLQGMGHGRHNVVNYARAKGYDLTGLEDRAEALMLKPNYAALDHSAKTCPLCALFRDELLVQGMQPRSWLTGLIKKEDPVLIMATCTYHRQNDKRVPLWDSGAVGLEFVANALQRNCVDRLVVVAQDAFAMVSVGAERDSEARKEEHVLGEVIKPADDLERVRSWITRCKDGHKKCNAPPPNVFYPTRLLDVGSLETPKTHIVLGSDVEGEYTTLSHCWGLKPIVRLTKETLTQYLSEIGPENLSKTFTEAIHITRSLGIRYLWIDSLCIIQDDAEDWERESATMGKVYSRGFLNITASTSSDGSGGCFFQHQDLDNGKQVRFPYKHKAGQAAGEVVISPIAASFAEDILDGPLAKRAWVIQETALSRRMVFYGKHQLYWRCAEFYESEQGDEDRSMDTAPHFNELPHRRSMNGKVEENLYWNWTVIRYSMCALTRNEDKLVALSGLASRFAGEFGHTYAAGLWVEYLHSGLLWHVQNTGCHRYTEYLAPSWSWASIDGPIVIDYNDQRGSGDVKIRAISVQSEVVGENKFGAVKGGTLTLTGKIQHVNIQFLGKSLGEESIWYPSVGDNARNIALDAGNINAFLLDTFDQTLRLGRAYLDENREPEGEVFALQMDIISGFLSQIGETATQRQNVLLLQSTSEGGTYRRIGKGRLCFEGSEDWFGTTKEKKIVIV
ncbi:heterokaryon incompatibility protein-domain-containing protein [Rhexocercosporidium sp. MPI-PUGE-AT-0058]|nr:heterokaryon incompatibility protein-domain-containing protein [Rhexocercosporidium sp. MPI-PUGE-AT-0058]